MCWIGSNILRRAVRSSGRVAGRSESMVLTRKVANSERRSGNTSEAREDMIAGPVGKTFLRYGVPWALSMVATGSAAVVDGIFVGRFAGAQALAAVNLAAPIWCLVSGLGFTLVTGGSVLAGRYMGEGRYEEASALCIKIFMTLLALIALTCGIMYARLEDVLTFLGAGDGGKLRGLCREYLEIVLLCCPVFPLSYGLSYFIRVDGRPLLASAGPGIAAGCNILLDALLVGYAGMSVRGAALATVLAYLAACLALIGHFFSARSRYIRPRRLGGWKEVLGAAWNGASEFVNEVSTGFIVLLFNLMLMESVGSNGVAAFTVVAAASLLGMNLLYGIGDSLAPLVSVNRGAKNFVRMDAFLRAALITAFGTGFAFFLVLTCFPEALADLFLPGDRETAHIARSFVLAWRWVFPLAALNMVLASYFTGRQWAASSMLVAASRSFVLPLIMLVVLPRLLGDQGIFYATSAAEGLTLCLAAALFWLGRRRCSSAARAC